VAGEVSQATSDIITSVCALYFGQVGVAAPFGSPVAVNLPQ
jgi:hypothetical protein